MGEYKETIIKKYQKIANLPDFLFSFTVPLRRKAIERLDLQPGSSILEVGCSSGANFSLLHKMVGTTGKIIGVDLSPDMVVQSQKRINKNGWRNITVIENSAEEVKLPGQYDGLLLFAMHDVLVSKKALDNLLNYIKPGGKIVSAGPKLASNAPGKFLNPLINLVYRRFAVSQKDKDKPWRLLKEQLVNLQIEEYSHGLVYLVCGFVE